MNASVFYLGEAGSAPTVTKNNRPAETTSPSSPQGKLKIEMTCALISFLNLTIEKLQSLIWHIETTKNNGYLGGIFQCALYKNVIIDVM